MTVYHSTSHITVEVQTDYLLIQVMVLIAQFFKTCRVINETSS